MVDREIEVQKKVAEFIRTLEMELKELQKLQRAAGWTQRNNIYAHVNANYTLQEKVLTSKNKWEQITFKCNVLQGILKLLLPHRDLYGLYDINGMEEDGYFGVMVPPVSVKQCHFERYCNYIKN